MTTEAKATRSDVSAAGSALGKALPIAHPTATIYMDESGVIKSDRFFGIGCLKAVDGPRLARALRRHRQVLEYEDELHWAHLDKASLRDERAFAMATAAFDTFFELRGTSFCCLVADRERGDLTRSYGTAWEAFEGLSIKALDAMIDRDELVSVLADHVDTPSGVRFEESIKSGVNERRGRLAIATVNRLHSHAVDALQLVDLLLGAAMFDFRQGAARGGLRTDSQKGRLSASLLDRCGVASFRPHGREISGKVKVEMQQRKRTWRGRRGGDPT